MAVPIASWLPEDCIVTRTVLHIFRQEKPKFLQDFQRELEPESGNLEEDKPMTSTKRLSATLVATLILAGAYFQSSEPNAKAQSKESHSGLEGTWRVTVTQQDCQSGAPLGPPFQSLLMFARGGTMSGTTSNSFFLPGQRSDDFGIWSQATARDYIGFSEAFIIFTGGPFTRGSQTIRHRISLTPDANGFTDIASVQFYDAGGKPLTPVPGCAAAIGQLLH
jgi:hypothetical protein